MRLKPTFVRHRFSTHLCHLSPSYPPYQLSYPYLGSERDGGIRRSLTELDRTLEGESHSFIHREGLDRARTVSDVTADTNNTNDSVGGVGGGGGGGGGGGRGSNVRGGAGSRGDSGDGGRLSSKVTLEPHNLPRTPAGPGRASEMLRNLLFVTIFHSDSTSSWLKIQRRFTPALTNIRKCISEHPRPRSPQKPTESQWKFQRKRQRQRRSR